MIASKRRVANCKNAQKSTGPRTTVGKRRSKINAFKHGLSIPITNLPEYIQEIEALAGLVAGEGADVGVIAAARDIAAAHLELKRINRCGGDLLNNPRHRIKHFTSRELKQRERRQIRIIKMVADLFVAKRGPENTDALISYLLRGYFELEKSPEPLNLEDSLVLIISKLAALERYRLRAFSRLRRAIRTFDVLQNDMQQI